MSKEDMVQYGLSDRDAARASSIVRALVSVAELIDHETPEVLAAIIRYIDDPQHKGELRPEHQFAIKHGVGVALDRQRQMVDDLVRTVMERG